MYKFESAVMGQVGSTPVAIALVLPVTASASVLTPGQAPTKLFVCTFESTRKDKISCTAWDVRDTAEGTSQYLDLPLCLSVSSYLTGTANAYFRLVCSGSTSLFFSGPEKSHSHLPVLHISVLRLTPPSANACHPCVTITIDRLTHRDQP